MAIKDTFIPAYYRVQISPSGIGGTAPQNGFVDDKESYEFDPLPTTLDNSLAKERGNVRYEEIIRRLGTNIDPVNHTPRQINAPGRDGDTAPTAFDFTVAFERPEYLQTEDENNPGSTLSGTDAVQRFVARALVTHRKDNRQVFNPETNSFGVRTNPAIIREVETEGLANTVADVEGNITVTEISNT